MYQSLIVVDSFFDRPQEVRRLALASDYPASEGLLTYPGRNSRQLFRPPGLDQVMSRLTNERLAGCQRPNIAHGRFRITLQSEPSRYLVHGDPSFLSWVGLVYLNTPEQCQGGTAFFRHRGLNSDRIPTEQALRDYGVENVAQLLEKDGNDEEQWEHLMTLPMRYNRLVLYRPWLWHSAGAAFGDSLENGRLVLLVFFEPAAGRDQGAPGGQR